MCTLMFGLDVLGPRTLVVAANRDEDPGRASEAPGALSLVPHVVGGRDLVAGGTWLAIRDGRAVVAVLNRRGADSPAAATGATPAAPSRAEGRQAPARRSRGLLALDMALAAPDGPPEAFAAAAIAAAERSPREHTYAPFTVVCISPERVWMMSLDATGPPHARDVPPGWHVATHEDLDDEREPRTRRLRRELAGFRPRSVGDAERRLLELLSLHDDTGEPAVCIHSGRMVTVSSSLFVRTDAGARYLHVEGRPCTAAPRDLSELLVPARTREVH